MPNLIYIRSAQLKASQFISMDSSAAQVLVRMQRSHIFITPMIKTMRNHLSAVNCSGNSVRSKTKTPHFVKNIRMQTFTHFGEVILYFEIQESPKDDVKFLPLNYASLQEALQNERKELLGTIVKGSINRDLIHPAFHSTRLVTFWKGFDIDLVKPILEIISDGRRRTRLLKEDKLLQDAVLSTFLEICFHVRKASPGLHQLITKGAV